jgi:succinate dehydrogenase/fumarate reductase flavoprotein subunit
MAYGTYAPILRKKAVEGGVKILDRIMVCELLKQDNKVIGAVGFHTTSGDLYVFKAGAVIIAAGGSSLKEVNRATHYWTSDGDAMAYRAGAEIGGKEFKMSGQGSARSNQTQQGQNVQEPKIIKDTFDAYAQNPAFGGYAFKAGVPAINAEGQPVTAPLWWEAHCGRIPTYVDLDAFSAQQIKDSRVFYDQMVGTAWLDKVGLDFSKGGKVQMSAGSVYAVQPVHGGVGIWPINTKCATIIPGLYAAGNNCGTMVSGANYASGGLGTCHAAVTGARAGLAATEYALKAKTVTVGEAELTRLRKVVCAPIERIGGFSPAWVTQVLQGFMVPYFILQMKHGERLQAALTLVQFLNTHLVPKLKAHDAHEWRLAQETKNMALNAEMVLRASLFRTESRGGHYREDYPRREDPAWLAWVKIKIGNQGEMKVLKEPVPEKWWPDLSKPYEERYPLMFPGE